MIFVTLGTQKFQFNRLLLMIDEMISKGTVHEHVFAQIGNSDYRPKNYEYSSFLDKKEFEKKVHGCDVLITHSGVATIMTGLRYQKKIIVVPRLSKYGEHVDNHQVQIAESFSERNYIAMYKEGDDLGKVVENVKKHNFNSYVSQRKQMVKIIQDYIDNM